MNATTCQGLAAQGQQVSFLQCQFSKGQLIPNLIFILKQTWIYYGVEHENFHES